MRLTTSLEIKHPLRDDAVFEHAVVRTALMLTAYNPMPHRTAYKQGFF